MKIFISSSTELITKHDKVSRQGLECYRVSGVQEPVSIGGRDWEHKNWRRRALEIIKYALAGE